MKVKELQERLAKLDPELDVLCYTEDEELVSKGRGFVLLDPVAIDLVDAESFRLKDGTPFFKFEKTEASQVVAILEVTSDF